MRIQFNPNQPIIKSTLLTESENNMLRTGMDDATGLNLSNTDKNQKKYKSGSAIVIATLATVASVFMLSRGFQKNTNKILNKIKFILEEKLAHTNAKESAKKKNFYEFFIRRINSFIQKSESINNITSLKDILFMKLMYKTKPTKNIHDVITRYFEKISQKTVFKSYEKTDKNFCRMYRAFDELDEQILKDSADETIDFGERKCTKRELIEEARSLRDLAKLAVGAFIDKKTIQARYEHINGVTSSLYSTFWDASFKDFWSKNNKFKRKEMWQTFIAAEQIKTDKTDISGNIAYIRNAVTYTNKDQTEKIKEYIKAIDLLIPAHDKEGISIIKKLEYFSKNPVAFQNNKELFFIELGKLKEHHIPIRANKNMSQTVEEYKQTNIAAIDKQVKDNRPGLLQDMLDIYYKIAPYELEQSGALLSLKKAVKSFDKSVELESVEFFDKVRDLRLGSAPTDVLTILFSFITLFLGLGHARTNDERTSIMLKTGIPIVGGIAAATYTATKLVNGGKSLAFGFLSGIILNRLGVIADNIRKNKNAEKHNTKM